MTIETATYISDLNVLYPEDASLFSQVDDHFRLIKSTLLATFTAIDGAVTASNEELSVLEDKTTGALLPATTKTVFYQAAAPTGWTLLVDKHDKVFRVVNTAPGADGGSWTISGVSINGHALTINEIPSHDHSGVTSSDGAHTHTNVRTDDNSGSCNYAHVRAESLAYLAYTQYSGDHTHTVGNQGSGSTHTHTLTHSGAWRPYVLDCIRCQKD